MAQETLHRSQRMAEIAGASMEQCPLVHALKRLPGSMHAIRRVLFMLGSILLVGLASQSACAEQPGILKYLKHGINVGEISGDLMPECCDSESQFQFLARHFDHVRLGVQLSYLYPVTEDSSFKSLIGVINGFTQRGPRRNRLHTNRRERGQRQQGSNTLLLQRSDSRQRICNVS